jgi:hypothetical protein
VKAFVKVTVVVLIVIGVGVATVGGLPSLLGPAHPYGKYPFRFSAAFPTYDGGHLRINQPLPPIAATPTFVLYDVVTLDYSASVTGAGVDTPAGLSLLHSLLTTDLWGYRTHTFSADGTTTTLAEPTCDNHEQPYPPGVCSDVEIVRDGNVIWLVLAAVRNAPTLAQDFVESFHPG